MERIEINHEIKLRDLTPEELAQRDEAMTRLPKIRKQVVEMKREMAKQRARMFTVNPCALHIPIR